MAAGVAAAGLMSGSLGGSGSKSVFLTAVRVCMYIVTNTHGGIHFVCIYLILHAVYTGKAKYSEL